MTLMTLTTDFGTEDYYVPALKGAILSHVKSVNFIDVSHHIRNHDIVQAAYTLKNAWKAFPKGTIHIVSVHNLGGDKNRFLFFEQDQHIFIGPDNVIFTLLFDPPPQYIYNIPFAGLNFTNVSQCVALIAGRIAQGDALGSIGVLTTDIVHRITLQPVTRLNQIRGAVIHVDNYDNVILNITRHLFQKIGKGRPFQLFFKRHDPITVLSNSYNDVPMGEVLCLFNSDYLEIAINMGKASEMLGLKRDDTVEIDFIDDHSPYDLLRD